tara:strand:- start:140 stop:283 length:144 start_codon:yes stop_codon:yes gene_type:complete
MTWETKECIGAMSVTTNGTLESAIVEKVSPAADITNFLNRILIPYNI